MSEKILAQMLDTLRGSSLADHARLEFSLLAVAWARLSLHPNLPRSLHLTRPLIAAPEALANVLEKLASRSATFGQAFGSATTVDLSLASVRVAFDLALQLAEAGVLDRLKVSDAITLLSSKSYGQWSLPPEVASLLVELAEVAKGDTAYTAWDNGGQLASRAVDHGAEVHLEATVKTPIAALVSLIEDKPFDIQFGEPIRNPSFIVDGRPRKFDVAIAFPPIGQRYDGDVADRDWFNRFPERTHSGSVLAIRHLLAHTKRRVVVGMPNSLTFSSGAERSLREDLVQRGMIHSVIAMPTGLLETTSIAFTILVLQPSGGLQGVQFINADEPHFFKPVSKARSVLTNAKFLADLSKNRAASVFSLAVPDEQVLGDGEAQLQPKRYLLSASAMELHSKLAGLANVELGAVVETVRPMPVSKSDAGMDVGEIGAADIPAHGYISAPGRNVRVEFTEKNRSNFLQPSDIVLIIKGSVGKVGIVPETVPPAGPGGWVAGQSAIVLRVIGSRIDPRALALQLRSDLGQQLLRQLVKGATIPLIQIRELMRLMVLVPDQYETQAAVVALEKERELQQQIGLLEERLTEVAANLWSFA